MSLQVITPFTFAPNKLTTNVVDTTNSWNGTVNYAVGDQILVSYGNPKDPNGSTWVYSIYQCIAVPTAVVAPYLDPTHWAYVGPSNPFKMFDSVNSSQSTAGQQIDVTVTSVKGNKLALLNLDAESVQITVTYSSTVVMSQTFTLVNPPLFANWYSYLFDSISYAKEFIADLPLYSQFSLNVKINKTGSTVACGTFVVGKSNIIADAITYGANVGITDYSRKEKNQFGDYNFIVRAFSKRADISFWIPNGSVDALQQYLASLRAIPTLYIGDDAYTSTAIYGYYKDFSITISNAVQSLCTLSLEGLT